MILVRAVLLPPTGLRTRRLPSGRPVQNGTREVTTKPGQIRARYLGTAIIHSLDRQVPEDTPQKCAAGRDAVQAIRKYRYDARAKISFGSSVE